MQVRDRTYGQAYQFVQNQEYISDEDLDILRRFYYVWLKVCRFFLLGTRNNGIFIIVKRKNDLIIPYDVFFQWNLIEYLCDIKTIHKKVMPS